MLNDYFVIKGKKDLIFKKDQGDFWVYDPIALEYYKIDEIGAEILYCISKNFNLEQIIEVLIEQYDVSVKECQEAILQFLENNPLQYVIYTNLIQSGLYLYLSPFSKGLVK